MGDTSKEIRMAIHRLGRALFEQSKHEPDPRNKNLLMNFSSAMLTVVGEMQDEEFAQLQKMASA